MADPAGSTLPLLAWISPAFPVGAYTYSHGLESAVDEGLVTDAASLSAWIDNLLAMGSVHNDAILAAAAWRAARAGDDAALASANDLALALAPSRERQLESVGQGNAFATAIATAWSGAARPGSSGDVAYPIAFGTACGVADMPLLPCLEALTLGFVQNLVSAAIRLSAIGQSDGQRVTAAALARVRDAAGAAVHLTLDDIGGCAQRSDIMAMRHETLYSRLFRS